MELYVHLPFCRQKCRYCDFVSYSGMDGLMKEYVDALLWEAEYYQEKANEPIRTVYFGGGTPSLLPPDLLYRLIEGLKDRLPLDTVHEWTVEANPGTVTPVWLETAIKGGINRISIGMQAAQDHLLKKLGRIHSMSDVKESVYRTRSAGFRNINLDLMFGLPGQTEKEWAETIELILGLKPEHISAYGLIPEINTPLFTDLQKGLLSLPDEDEERKMYELLLTVFDKANYLQYEISNFSKPGYRCEHNIGYWTQIPYLGLGVSAASMTDLIKKTDGMHYLRRTNTKDIKSYLYSIRNRKPLLEEKTIINPAEARFETMMLGLRMNRGVNAEEFQTIHGKSIESFYGEKLHLLTLRGLVRFEDNCWRLTRAGMDLQNSVLVELME